MWQVLGACRILRNTAPLASRTELELVHDRSHVERVIAAGDVSAPARAAAAQQELRNMRRLGVTGGTHEDVYVVEHTSAAVRKAAGCAADLARRVMAGEIRAGISLSRPAGHHAGKASVS